jgi:ABC-type sugar transport system ATPase subunit
MKLGAINTGNVTRWSLAWSRTRPNERRFLMIFENYNTYTYMDMPMYMLDRKAVHTDV